MQQLVQESAITCAGHNHFCEWLAVLPQWFGGIQYPIFTAKLRIGNLTLEVSSSAAPRWDSRCPTQRNVGPGTGYILT